MKRSLGIYIDNFSFHFHLKVVLKVLNVFLLAKTKIRVRHKNLKTVTELISILICVIIVFMHQCNKYNDKKGAKIKIV